MHENLVLLGYQKVFDIYVKKNYQPVKITLTKNDIPISRGLGSSASCIVAGVFAANAMYDLNLTKEELAHLAVSLEGHADNVFAAIFGNLTAVFKEQESYFHDVFIPSKDFAFHVLIPQKQGSTKKARSILPNVLNIEDSVYHLSRTIHIPKAVVTGNFDMLKRVLKDRIHELHRYPSIPLYHKIIALKENPDYIVCISGSGPSVLVITKVSSTLEVDKEISKAFDVVSLLPTSGVEVIL